MTSKKDITTSEPQGDPCQELHAEVETLRAELDSARAEIERLRTQASAGRAGYRVTTPNRNYAGMTAGVQFRGGTAFIPASPEGDRLARLLADEFSYTVEYVTDWQAMPEGKAVAKSFIDSLVIPDRR